MTVGKRPIKTPEPSRDVPAPSPDVPYEGPAYTRAAGADHSFTLQAIMELQKSVSQLGAKVDRLVGDVDKQSGKLSDLDKSIDRFKTAFWVGGGILALVVPIIAGMFWWSIGDKINDLKNARPPIATPAPPSSKPT